MAKKSGVTPGQRSLFGETKLEHSPSVAPPQVDAGERIWTEDKARLIASYLRTFLMITKHGVYMDAFAGPQYNDKTEAWSAKLVIDIQPAWMRRYYLCDRGKKQAACLQALAAASPSKKIIVARGDANATVLRWLQDGEIKPKEAAFCLLDQRTFECHWKTVKAIASYPKHKYKIELFYFLAIGWLDRAMAASRNQQRLVAWWGNERWQALRDMKNVNRAIILEDRMREELGYASAVAWPIHSKKNGGRLMYYMVHATDHPAAPGLMERAYNSAVRSRKREGPTFPW